MRITIANTNVLAASADRRPVDPPPVVELRIFEGEGNDRDDITFGYNANFFLFATLEMARPMANGRVQPSQQQVPVLTGMPVSGMAYLDRPTEAGYFIFPDLSVRHEGRYKLSFNLYEQTKDDRDADAEPSRIETKPQILGENTPDSSFDWRLEVKSAPFTVYSAKKFPGLAESTSLSRTVAEQGCRVRIRRDVRMRRRDEKTSREFEEPEDEYMRAGRTPSIHDYRERSRSLSGERDEKRPGGNLNFGGQPYGSTPQFAAPLPPAQYSVPHYPPAPQPFRNAPAQPQSYGAERAYQYPHSAYPSTAQREREYEPEFRRQSYSAGGAHTVPYPPLDTGYNRNPVHYASHLRPHSPLMQSSTTLPPLKFQNYDSQTTSPGLLSSIPKIAPDLPSPGFDRYQDRSYGHHAAPLPLPSEALRNGKRSYDSVFTSSAARQSEPLYNHARPSSSHNSQNFDEDDDLVSLSEMRMQYKRADGARVTRDLPIVLE